LQKANDHQESYQGANDSWRAKIQKKDKGGKTPRRKAKHAGRFFIVFGEGKRKGQRQGQGRFA
jgi:hypothetical protein